MNIGKILKTSLKALAWIAGIWLGLLVILEIALSPAVLTRIVNRVAVEFIDGDIRFGEASASMFRRFPSMTVSLKDFAITYPADRFDEKEKEGIQGHLMYHGCGEEADTLASFDRFSVGVSLPALLTGTIRIPHLRLEGPRIFAHSYHDGTANWDIFTTGAPADTTEVEDTTEESGGMPKIVLGRIRLTEHPHIVYTDSRDTIFAMIDVKQIGFNGKVNLKKVARSRVGLAIDSMFVAGRLAKDTLALGLDRLHIHEHNRHMDVNASAKTFLATSSFGRMSIPVELSGTVSFPKDSVLAVKAENVLLDIATVPIKADADLRFKTGATGIKANVAIDECQLDDVLQDYVKNFIPEVAKVSTDAKISLAADIDGDYIHGSGDLPSVNASLHIPASDIRHSDFKGQVLNLAVDMGAATMDGGKIDVSIDRATAKATGLDLDIKGNAGDILGDDPLIKIDGRLDAHLDSLVQFLPDTLGIEAGGKLSAQIDGKALLSQLNMYNFSRSSLQGNVSGKDIIVKMPKDTIDIVIDSLSLNLGPETIKSRRNPSKTFRLIGATGNITKADINFKDAMAIEAEKFAISAKNSVDMDNDADTTKKILPFGGRISAYKLMVKDASGSSVRLDETSNGFQLLPKKGQPKVPMLTLTSKNKRIFLVSDVNRAILTDASINARAAMNTVERRQKAKAFMDSLARTYPEVPRDSLFTFLRAKRATQPIPEWLKEEDFRKQDINLQLDETLAKYFREWDINGGLDIRTGIVMTPYFPLRNILRGFEASFNNNTISIDSLKVRSGQSEIGAKGSLTGLKRALLGRRGALKLDLDVTSSGMNANELLRAYSTGSNFNPETLKGSAGEVSNSEFLQQVTVQDTTELEDAPSLIVVPGNIVADLRINAGNITYSDLQIDTLMAKATMKERCVQIIDTKAESNMGAIGFEGFYATRTKEDLKTGFSLNFEDITAEKVIALMPAVDTIMPLLKSFSGKLNCEVAATADIDTSMNIVMPSINGIIRIGGEDLTISNNDMFRKLARTLMFRNKKEGHVKKMTVEGVIKDNKLEVFPFVLELDRYTLAMSGIQNLDMSFRYHASLIKSPFLIRLGIDLYGPDFDNMKFKIGKAKYKNKNVPVFSTVIDKTKINLVESIRGIFEKGVEAAINENREQTAITEHKKNIGYVQAVDQKLEALSESEQKQLEADQAAENAAENTETGTAAEGAPAEGDVPAAQEPVTVKANE